MNPLSLLTFPFKLLWAILSFPISLIWNVLTFVTNAAWNIVSFPFSLGWDFLGKIANAVVGTSMALIMLFVPHASVEPSATVSASVSPSQAVAVNYSPTSTRGYDVAPIEKNPTVKETAMLIQYSTSEADQYMDLIRDIDPNLELFEKVEKGNVEGQIIITVTNE